MPCEAFPPLPGLTVPKQFSQGPRVGSHPSPCHSQLRTLGPCGSFPSGEFSTSLGSFTWCPASQYVHETEQENFLFALSIRAEPLRKKKKVDPKKDQAVKDRLKKRIRRLEKASQELIPIEDFIIPLKFMDKVR